MPTRYRSFFWPAVLILAGVIALLVNTGKLPADRLYLLFDLWPVILIVIGLEIIVRRSVRGPNTELAAALIVLLAIAGAAGYVALAPNPSATHTHDWAESVGSLNKVAIEINAGSATVTLSATSDIGTDLYRAHIEYSGAQPQVQLDRSSATLSISQASGSFLQNRHFVLALKLNPNVHVASLSLNSGAGTEDITLGPPSGKVPITINAGALTLHVHRAQSAASVAASCGSISLTADGGATQHAIGNLDYQTPGFNQTRDAYVIEVNGGACTVTLDTVTGSD
ncbi:MAG TPA: DUF5668 domain-containing protein [Candidatus Sulfotelmatobacter sp.]|nr:DUF5668 domain-containing protein [Candidatus Sulfotelmatobacter sp.]